MHVLGNFGPGGAEMGVLRLIRGLTVDRMRHSIVILGTNRSLLEELQANDIPCHALGIEGRSYSAFRSLARLFRREQVDIVHVNNLAPWIDAALGAKLTGCRCIETFHGIEHGRLHFSLGRQMLLRGASLLTTRITAVGDEAADLMANLTGIERGAVQVIFNGIDTRRFVPPATLTAKRSMRRTKGLPEDALIFGCVAALRPVKNHRGLLQAFASVVQHSTVPALLVLVGDGPLESVLRELAGELAIGERVIFLGRRADIPELLQCLDVFVLNSDTEGLSYAVLEAMACGLPLIGTAVGANVSLVRAGSQGQLVAAGDEIALAESLAAALTDPARLAAMGMAARQWIEAEYGIDRMFASYRELYQEIVDIHAQ